ncbi:type 4 fimbrial biogenesis protein PilY2 [Pseudomonas sp. BAY1663]|uniref:PilY2 family type 4a fimbrial biogenesis protein n=1 Tax=Pseudomonas sp. BAY1663 TaxID=1439940 RepID=UPI00042E00CC|nr:PilY2 family type 4a fimbrial biogenesis protein [Pseudomonas sp. BAY1663]EXF46422.1 type 4 fimbrial biogenesis protein PilY2 [Pseudomonas sp. BAY1663]
MNHRFPRLLAIVTMTLLTGIAHSATFEASGTISDVQLGNNLIVVEKTTYSLPNKTALNGTPAILQLQPGYLIGFSGTEASPHSIIDSIYLYPESVRSAKQGEHP